MNVIILNQQIMECLNTLNLQLSDNRSQTRIEKTQVIMEELFFLYLTINVIFSSARISSNEWKGRISQSSCDCLQLEGDASTFLTETGDMQPSSKQEVSSVLWIFAVLNYWKYEGSSESSWGRNRADVSGQAPAVPWICDTVSIYILRISLWGQIGVGREGWGSSPTGVQELLWGMA